MSEQALHALTQQIAHTKNPLNKRFYEGVLALLQEALDDAEAAFLDVLSQNQAHADARTNLGVIALKRNKPQQAIMYFSEALGFDEQHENARNNLAATFIHHNRFENARTHYEILLKNHPDNTEYHYNMGVADMALGGLQDARAHFKCVLQKNPKHAASLTNLASIASSLKQTADAIHYLKRAKAADPNDTSSAFMLDALTGDAKMRAPSNQYTKNLFDNYALHYESHMCKALNYNVPQALAKCVHQLILEQTPHTLDIGCGTGLSGHVLREVSTHLTGIDLSAKMLTEARAKAIYDDLFEIDAIAYLSKHQATFSLITAADVLPYFGELNTLFQHIKAALMPSGYFIFTTEISDSSDFILQTTARFAHHPDYIQALATQHGFCITQSSILPARKHGTATLHVMLYTLQKRL